MSDFTFNFNELMGGKTSSTFSNGAWVAIIHISMEEKIVFMYAKKTSNKPYTVCNDWSKYKIAKFLSDNKFRKI